MDFVFNGKTEGLFNIFLFGRDWTAEALIRAMTDYGWLHYVQEAKDKAQRILYIEKIFEDGNEVFFKILKVLGCES